MRQRPATGSIVSLRPAVLGLGRVVGSSLALVNAAPLDAFEHHHHDGEPEGGYTPSPGGTPVWVLMVASIALVLLGGVFAGLTIALMGQDSIYLQVVSGDPTEPQHKNARRVLQLLKRGKHWVLVTLLLANVIVNESLPVVLDRTLGGGVAAVVGSTVLIVIFGEVVPQSVCVRYGLPIGGLMSKPVLGLMLLLSPVAWPTAKLLDWILGEDHGTVYKKSGLKTLVTLHKSLGELSERLNQDEVTIITAVLDLKDKPVSEVMTPMDDVFTLSEEHILDEKTMDKILYSGYSRIPIYRSGSPTDFVGIMLVKTLITYDPEDRIPVKEVPLGAIVETRPETSCLDIINFFQEGKSHMVLVSEFPGADHGALGVVTLEDVIEELIGEEIVDESDVYVDVHKAIRRLTPAPRARNRVHVEAAAAAAAAATAHATGKKIHDPTVLVDIVENDRGQNGGTHHIGSYGAQSDTGASQDPPKTAVFMKRRSSAGPDGRFEESPVPVKASLDEMKRQFRLGPANNAANPRSNHRANVFKIKQGLATPMGDGKMLHVPASAADRPSIPRSASGGETAARSSGTETSPLLARGHSVSGAHRLSEGYGSDGSPLRNEERADN